MAGDVLALTAWEVARTGAEALVDPTDIHDGLEWLPARVPGTVADAWRTAGRWSVDDTFDFDADDWWFRTRFAGQPGRTAVLSFGGIATFAEVWLNGQLVLTSDNMFHEHELAVDLAEDNELVVVCRSLNRRLAQRKPRPQWRTRLVDAQGLRWIRTTFLGRMPAALPHCAPVGPWRPVTVLPAAGVRVNGMVARTEGTSGSIDVTLTTNVGIGAAWVELGDQRYPLNLSVGQAGPVGTVTIPDVVAWWPATHGTPHLYDCTVVVEVDGSEHVIDVRRLGFRSVEIDRTDGAFTVLVNGTALFCRGGCWTPPDPVRLSTDRDALRHAVEQVRRAGGNMIRVTGTGVYEQDELFELCDELGVMVWHDLAFANVDQPLDDDAYRSSVEREMEQFLRRAASHPSLTVVCGGSEVEQQAAMMGVDPAVGRNRVGRDLLEPMAKRLAPGVGTVACSPSGGDFAFHLDEGVSHYYGVGAYRRPLSDVRTCGARFVAESLAFAAVPCRQTVDQWGVDPREPTSPQWKQRVPRDRGTAWDFDDVRDHYVEAIFGVRPVDVRYADPDRYLDLGRAALAEAVRATVSELRRPTNRCAGVLVLTQHDAVLGPGWGLIDAAGRAKSSHYGLRAASMAQGVSLHDEGLNGLRAAVHNDGNDELLGELIVRLFGRNGAVIDEATTPVKLHVASSAEIRVDAMFGRFLDLSYAYRFGPAHIDVVEATLHDHAGQLLQRTHLLPAGHHREQRVDLGLAAWFSADGRAVTVRSDQFAQFVSIDVTDAEPVDNWFHLSPGEERTVALVDAPLSPAGTVRALNGEGLQPIVGEPGR